MELDVVEANEHLTHVALKGSLDMEGVRKVEDRFVAQLATRRKPSIVDVSGVDFIASLGMGMFVRTAQALSTHGKKLVLLSPTPAVEEALRAAVLHTIFPIARTREEALEKLL